MSWLTQLFFRGRKYRELSASIREHLEERIADLMERGMTREEAERTARREFGNVALIERRSRDLWQWPTLESILADLRFALRQFRMVPGFAGREPQVPDPEQAQPDAKAQRNFTDPVSRILGRFCGNRAAGTCANCSGV